MVRFIIINYIENLHVAKLEEKINDDIEVENISLQKNKKIEKYYKDYQVYLKIEIDVQKIYR